MKLNAKKNETPQEETTGGEEKAQLNATHEIRNCIHTSSLKLEITDADHPEFSRHTALQMQHIEDRDVSSGRSPHPAAIFDYQLPPILLLIKH